MIASTSLSIIPERLAKETVVMAIDDTTMVLCQDLVQHKMRNFNYFQLTNSDSLATLAL